MFDSVLQLASELISCPSVTPDDANCQDIIIQYLKTCGFKIKRINSNGVSNLWAYIGDLNKGKTFVFAGHTDVVTPGEVSKWSSKPFTPKIEDGFLIGRGAADMKSSLAAMIIAARNFVLEQKAFDGAIAFLITSDEEGPALYGTQEVLKYLENENIKINYCLIGEPSSYGRLADTIHHGRRGSLSCSLDIIGKQGHVGYPNEVINPAHQSLNHLSELHKIEWVEDKSFVPTSLQITSLNTSSHVENVVPNSLTCKFNVRFSEKNPPNVIKDKVSDVIDSLKVKYKAHWKLNGLPYLTKKNTLINSCQAVVHKILGYKPTLSTKGGTSDGRFIAKYCDEILELGLNTETMHAINEKISISELKNITKIYHEILKEIFS